MDQNNYRRVVHFENGYSASVICNRFVRGHHNGMFEVAVMYDGKLVYDTSITPDVISNLDFEDVVVVFQQIKDLPPR